MTILDDIVAHKQTELPSIQAWSQSKPPATMATGRFYHALLASNDSTTDPLGPRLIAEIKPSSPSAGVLQTKPDVLALATVYSRYAVGMSVLTDARYFGGSLDSLRQVSALPNSVPTLCKDFILDPVQVTAARQAGAEAVLLIVKILPPNQLRQLAHAIRALGMTPVIEVQNKAEVELLLAMAQPQTDVVLINNRNLSTFSIHLDTTQHLMPLLPPSFKVISASGIETPEDVATLLPHTRNMLVGSALMKSDNPAHLLQQFLGVLDV
jgi:indole-3-glycerol phosphate synthase